MLLTKDIIIYKIFNLLPDKYKLNLTSINRNMNILKYSIINFENQCQINKLTMDKWFYNKLSDINVNEIMKFPCLTKKITFGKTFNHNIRNTIPDSITHLTFGRNFDQDIKNSIPNSVTHLTFGCKFQPLYSKCNTKFGYSFNFWRLFQSKY